MWNAKRSTKMMISSNAYMKKVEEVNRDTEVTEIMTIEEEMNIRWHYGYDEGSCRP